MGLFDWLASATPGGVAGDAANRVIGGVFEGVDKLIRDFKLPPEQMLAYERFVEEQRAKFEEIAASDRDSARKREIALHDWTPAALAFLIVATFGGAQWFVFTHTLPAGSETLVARVLGTIDMALGLVLGYYFGSSASSARKDTLLRDAMK